MISKRWATVSGEGAGAGDGLAGLCMDSDGKIDASDAQISSFRIRQDANPDGVSDVGELKTLADVGIVCLCSGPRRPAEGQG